MSKKGVVYLICNAAEGIYKIGVTRSTIEKRLKQLQTGAGHELHLVYSHESDYPYYIERMLHHEYHNDNTLNEWFELDYDSVLQFKALCAKYENVINEMKDNTFFMKGLK